MPSQGESTDLPPITINKGGATSRTQSGSMHLRRNTAAGPPRSPPKSSMSSPHVRDFYEAKHSNVAQAFHHFRSLSLVNMQQRPPAGICSLSLLNMQQQMVAGSTGREGRDDGRRRSGEARRSATAWRLFFFDSLSISPIAAMIPTGKGSSGCEPPTPSSTQKGKKLESRDQKVERGCSPGPAAGTSGDDGERWCTLATTLLHASSLAL
nr:hypothetical protein Iba_chr02bCG10010 [Ipomoea batatas]